MDNPREPDDIQNNRVLEYYKKYRHNPDLSKYFSGPEASLSGNVGMSGEALREPLEVKFELSTLIEVDIVPMKEEQEEVTENKNPSPASSTTSVKKLEWDNGADIGYVNSYKISTRKSASYPCLLSNDLSTMKKKSDEREVKQLSANKEELRNMYHQLTYSSETSCSPTKEHLISSSSSSPPKETTVPESSSSQNEPSNSNEVCEKYVSSSLSSNGSKMMKYLKQRIGDPVAKSTPNEETELKSSDPEGYRETPLLRGSSKPKRILATSTTKKDAKTSSSTSSRSGSRDESDSAGDSSNSKTSSKGVEESIAGTSKMGEKVLIQKVEYIKRKNSASSYDETKSVEYIKHQNKNNSSEKEIKLKTTERGSDLPEVQAKDVTKFDKVEPVQYEESNNSDTNASKSQSSTSKSSRLEEQRKSSDQDLPPTKSSNEMILAEMISLKHSRDLNTDIKRSIDILQKLLKSKKYDHATKKHYIKKIVQKIVESKYSDDSTTSSELFKPRKCNVATATTDGVKNDVKLMDNVPWYPIRSKQSEAEALPVNSMEPTRYNLMGGVGDFRFHTRNVRKPGGNKVTSDERTSSASPQDHQSSDGFIYHRNRVNPNKNFTGKPTVSASRIDEKNWKNQKTLSEILLENRGAKTSRLGQGDYLLHVATNERQHQLSWINNEIEHLVKLKDLLEKRNKGEVRDPVASLLKMRVEDMKGLSKNPQVFVCKCTELKGKCDCDCASKRNLQNVQDKKKSVSLTPGFYTIETKLYPDGNLLDLTVYDEKGSKKYNYRNDGSVEDVLVTSKNRNTEVKLKPRTGEHRGSPQSGPYKVCKNCGRLFLPPMNDSQVCLCAECNEANPISQDRRPATNKAKVCESCGNLFVASKDDPNLCICKRCSLDRREKIEQSNKISRKVCKACGRTFAPSMNDPGSSLCEQCSAKQRAHRRRICRECGNSFSPSNANPEQDVCDGCLGDTSQPDLRCTCQKVTFSEPLELDVCRCSVEKDQQWARKRLEPMNDRPTSSGREREDDVCSKCHLGADDCRCLPTFKPKKPRLVGLDEEGDVAGRFGKLSPTASKPSCACGKGQSSGKWGQDQLHQESKRLKIRRPKDGAKGGMVAIYTRSSSTSPKQSVDEMNIRCAYRKSPSSKEFGMKNLRKPNTAAGGEMAPRYHRSLATSPRQSLDEINRGCSCGKSRSSREIGLETLRRQKSVSEAGSKGGACSHCLASVQTDRTPLFPRPTVPCPSTKKIARRVISPRNSDTFIPCKCEDSSTQYREKDVGRRKSDTYIHRRPSNTSSRSSNDSFHREKASRRRSQEERREDCCKACKKCSFLAPSSSRPNLAQSRRDRTVSPIFQKSMSEKAISCKCPSIQSIDKPRSSFNTQRRSESVTNSRRTASKKNVCCKACGRCSSTSPKSDADNLARRTQTQGGSPVSHKKESRTRERTPEKNTSKSVGFRGSATSIQTKKSCQCCTCTNCAVQTKRLGEKNVRCQCCICENCGTQATPDRNGRPIKSKWCRGAKNALSYKNANVDATKNPKDEVSPDSKAQIKQNDKTKCVSACKSSCAPKPPCKTPLCPSMGPSCEPCGSSKEDDSTPTSNGGTPRTKNDVSQSYPPCSSPVNQSGSCDSLEYPCKPLKPQGERPPTPEEDDSESSFMCPSKSPSCPAKPPLCPGAGNVPCPSTPPAPCPKRKLPPCADKPSKPPDRKEKECPGDRQCPTKNLQPCPGKSSFRKKEKTRAEHFSVCMPLTINSSSPLEVQDSGKKSSNSTSLSQELPSHEEAPGSSSNTQPTPSPKGDAPPLNGQNVQLFMCTPGNGGFPKERNSISEPKQCSCNFDGCKCSQTATHEEKVIQCPAFKQCTCQTDQKEDANIQCTCKEEAETGCECGNKNCRCGADTCECKKSGSSSSSSSSNGSSSSLDTLISCVCCKKKNILKELMSKLPLCGPCQDVHQKCFYPYTYSNPLHSCICYSLVDQGTLCQLKSTLTELERLDIYQQYCEILKNCKCCKKCGCKCKLPKKFKNGCAYFLKLEEACPNKNCGQGDNRCDYNYEEYGEGEEEEEEEERNYLPEVTVKVPSCRGVCAQKKKNKNKNETEKQYSCPSIQTFLCAMRPEFIENAERRRRILRNAALQREENGESRKLRFIDQVNYFKQKCLNQQARSESSMYGPYGTQAKTYCVFDVELDAPKRIKPRVFRSFKEMKDLTRRRYLHLSEVRSKKDIHREKRLREANRLLANTFTRRLQRSTLRGNVDIPPNVRVVSY